MTVHISDVSIKDRLHGRLTYAVKPTVVATVAKLQIVIIQLINCFTVCLLTCTW